MPAQSLSSTAVDLFTMRRVREYGATLRAAAAVAARIDGL